MAVAVTGASGFVGRALVLHLQAHGVEVVPILRNTDSTGSLQLVDIVVHLAARVHVMAEKATHPIAEFRKANVDATVLLARQAVAAGVTRFVFMSSVKVNGEETSAGLGFTELDQPNPQDAYGISKWEAELALRQVSEETGLEVVIIRSPLVYGPGVKANFAALMRAVIRRWPMPLGAVQNARSLVGLDNLVDFIYLCMLHPAAANETFLVSDGNDASSAQLVRDIAAVAGIKPNLWRVPSWILELAGAIFGKRAAVQRLCGNLQVDITKARSLLGWRPPVSRYDGLKKAVSKV
jgi:nucleoside-diphosphate-sugar epimerase